MKKKQLNYPAPCAGDDADVRQREEYLICKKKKKKKDKVGDPDIVLAYRVSLYERELEKIKPVSRCRWRFFSRLFRIDKAPGKT